MPPEPDETMHRITGRDVWNKLVAMDQKIDRLESRSDIMETKLDNHYNRMESQSKKIRSIELRLYGVISGVIGAIGLEIARMARLANL